jgi:hypothetical protein
VKGWTDTNAYFKGKKGNVNIGLGNNGSPALTIFNNNIESFKAVAPNGP